MILTGQEIRKAIERGEICIDPFDPTAIKPNSYDWRLGRELLVSKGPLDAAHASRWERHEIGSEGYVLLPDTLYLGVTLERTASERYAQLLNGDRSTGILGIWVHVSAPLGHMGHAIRWTLEIRVTKPVRVYAEMPFGRLVFLRTSGEPSFYGASEDKYAASLGAERSRLHEEFRR